MFWLAGGPYYIVIGIFQLICIIHAMKTNRRDWIYLLIFLPAIGAIAYFVRELWPEIQAGNFMEQMQRVLFPNSAIRDLQKRLRIADTEANRLNLAREYEKQKKYDKALELTKSCLEGFYANDAGIMQDVARLSFYNNNFAESIAYYDKVLKAKTKFDKPEDELVYARALEGCGSLAKAEEEYVRIIRIHHSMEARYHYGMLLKRQSRIEEARTQFQAVKDERELQPKYVLRMNAQWIRQSRIELATLR